jgi:hypothetical protein
MEVDDGEIEIQVLAVRAAGYTASLKGEGEAGRWEREGAQ